MCYDISRAIEIKETPCTDTTLMTRSAAADPAAVVADPAAAKARTAVPAGPITVPAIRVLARSAVPDAA